MAWNKPYRLHSPAPLNFRLSSGSILQWQSCQLILIYSCETSTRYSLTQIWYSVSGFYCSGFGVSVFCFPVFCHSAVPGFTICHFSAMLIKHRIEWQWTWLMVGFLKYFIGCFDMRRASWYFRNSHCCLRHNYILAWILLNACLWIFRGIDNFLWNMREIFNSVRDSL